MVSFLIHTWMLAATLLKVGQSDVPEVRVMFLVTSAQEVTHVFLAAIFGQNGGSQPEVKLR